MKSLTRLLLFKPFLPSTTATLQPLRIMPRPSIHKTLEEKLQASREKNQRHYAK